MTVDPTIVLLSDRLAAHRAELETWVPGIRVEVMTPDGNVPEHARSARVLYRAGLSHAALRTALAQLPDLRWIHTASAGFNWVLIPEVVARPIALTRSANVLDVPIAEFVVAATLALLKDLPAFFRAQEARTWARPTMLHGLHGKTVGIVGAGAIGRAAATRFRGFGTHTIGLKRTPASLPEFDEVRGPDGLDALLRECDVVVLACPLTPETRHLIDRTRLASMRPSALLINVARGEIVVEADLIAALRDGVIAGAALDVFATEPLPSDSPLWELENVIVTPHASYLDPSNAQGALEEFLDNLRRFLAGEELRNTITSAELGY